MKTILGLAAATLLLAWGGANATEPSPISTKNLGLPDVSQTLLEPAQFRRCHFWRRECAARWGWGNRRFRRCLIQRGC
jgi:hypothetical protein